MNINTAIIEGSKFLKKKCIKHPGLDSEILLAKALKKKREYIILNLDKKIKDINLKTYKDLIQQRSLGKPIAYLTKKNHSQLTKNFFKR